MTVLQTSEVLEVSRRGPIHIPPSTGIEPQLSHVGALSVRFHASEELSDVTGSLCLGILRFLAAHPSSTLFRWTGESRPSSWVGTCFLVVRPSLWARHFRPIHGESIYSAVWGELYQCRQRAWPPARLGHVACRKSTPRHDTSK